MPSPSRVCRDRADRALAGDRGREIAAHSEPEKIRWPRPVGDAAPEPGTLMLRVEGPTAVEISTSPASSIERVNRFFGWRAVADLALRQAPLRHAHRQSHCA